MLPNRSHWHFAKKLYPERERRLAWFAAEDSNAQPEEENAAVPATPESAEAKPKAEDVSEQSTDTQAEVAKTLQLRESLVQTLTAESQKVKQRLSHLEDVRKQLASKLDPQQMREMEKWAKHTDKNMTLISKVLTTITGWQQGTTDPIGYENGINAYLKATGHDQRMQLQQENRIEPSEWFALPEDEKRRITEEINEQVESDIQLEESLGDMEKIINKIHKIIDEYEEWTQGVETNLLQDEQQLESGGLKGMIYAVNQHIRWVSINDVIGAFKKYFEAYGKAWERRGAMVQNQIAEGLGNITRFLPMGAQVQSELAAQRESDNDDEKKAMKEQLEQTKTPFKDAIQKLTELRNSPNKFHGVLEYMASHGWLYDYDSISGTAFGVKIPLAPGWTKSNLHEYKISLSVEDSNGQDKQKKDMENLIGSTDSIPPIIETLEIELRKHNYWSAFKGLEIAMNKGKIGESGTWVATTLLDHIRRDPDAIRYIPIDLYDQMGNIGIQHPAWTTTFLKLDRSNLASWQKTGNPSRFKEAGHLAHAISLIEEEMKQKFGDISNPTEHNQIVAQILAAQVVTKNGQSISIFTNRYSAYRQQILNTPTTISPGKADDDFYGNISDMQLIGSDGVRAILAVNTQGAFNDNTKALSYIENLFLLDSQLQGPELTEAQRNLRAETRRKMNKYFGEDVARHGPSSIGWISRETRSNQNVMREMINRNMLDAGVADLIYAQKPKPKKAA